MTPSDGRPPRPAEDGWSDPMATQDLRQGHILDIPALPLVAPDKVVRDYPTPHGAVLLSQTCDIVRPERQTVVASPVSYLDEAEARQSRNGQRPRYVPLNELGDRFFADLDVIGTLDKDGIASLRCRPGIDHAKEDQVIKLGGLIGRRFSRFPFPDEVVPWLAPLIEVIESKVPKASSGEALALGQVEEFRVEAKNGWSVPPYELQLVVILVSGGTAFEVGEVCPPTLWSWLRGQNGQLRQTAGNIANRLFAHRMTANQSPPSEVEEFFLWEALAEAWSGRCKPRDKFSAQREVMEAVAGGEITSEVVSEDDYSLAHYRRSVGLDVDYLSLAPLD